MTEPPLPISETTNTIAMVAVEDKNVDTADELFGAVSLNMIIGVMVALAATVVAVRELKKAIVGWIRSEVQPSLQEVKHEVTNNSGASMKDKIEVLVKEVSQVRRDVASMHVTVDKVETQQNFWGREAKKDSERISKLEGVIDGLPKRFRRSKS